MDVAIVNLTGGGLSGGYVKYLRLLVPLLRADARVRRLHLVMPRNAPSPSPPDVETIAWPAGDARTGYRKLRQHLGRLAPDVVFIPTARWLDCGPTPTVVMVRNMEPLTVPFGGNSPLEAGKNLVRAYAARVACRRATRVLAVSRHVREFLTRRWRISPEKIGLVYHGIEAPLPPAAAVEPRAMTGRDPGRFAFAAGSIRPARGLEELIRALARLRERGSTPGLVIAGEPDAGTGGYGRRMARLAEAVGVASQVVWAGRLTAAEMAWCFHRCAVFVTTSRAEACPNTALEAMSYGCQVVSTRQPPMPEFFRDVGRYYGPGDAGELAVQIGHALAATEEERRRREEIARAQAAGFRWDETAQKTLEQLALAVGRQRARA